MDAGAHQKFRIPSKNAWFLQNETKEKSLFAFLFAEIMTILIWLNLKFRNSQKCTLRT